MHNPMCFRCKIYQREAFELFIKSESNIIKVCSSDCTTVNFIYFCNRRLHHSLKCMRIPNNILRSRLDEGIGICRGLPNNISLHWNIILTLGLLWILQTPQRVCRVGETGFAHYGRRSKRSNLEKCKKNKKGINSHTCERCGSWIPCCSNLSVLLCKSNCFICMFELRFIFFIFYYGYTDILVQVFLFKG